MTRTKLDFMHQLRGGYIFIKGIKSKPNGNLREQFSNVLATKGARYSTNEGMSGYPHYLIIFTQRDPSIATYLERDLGITNINYDRLAALLDTHNLNDGNANNVVIIFPLYCKKVKFCDRTSRLIANYDIHKSLIKHSKANLIRSNPPKQFNSISVGKHIEVTDEISTIAIPRKFEIFPDDDIKIEILHTKFGKIAEDDINPHDILGPPYVRYSIRFI
jgi:hypothetical protein